MVYCAKCRKSEHLARMVGWKLSKCMQYAYNKEEHPDWHIRISQNLDEDRQYDLYRCLHCDISFAAVRPEQESETQDELEESAYRPEQESETQDELEESAYRHPPLDHIDLMFSAEHELITRQVNRTGTRKKKKSMRKAVTKRRGLRIGMSAGRKLHVGDSND